MKIAVIGSRGANIPNIEAYFPPETTEIISFGEEEANAAAKECAALRNIKLTEIIPEHGEPESKALQELNDAIIENADIVLIFWDGRNHRTKSLIDKCNEMGVRTRVFV
ncbi:MAG: hypothetical protein FWH55_02000 [Oscillospiraceae bacterium]|nr:hypothetical protein [Oscillospiraceae bacterium]